MNVISSSSSSPATGSGVALSPAGYADEHSPAVCFQLSTSHAYVSSSSVAEYSPKSERAFARKYGNRSST
jgi:hypothetical protein